MASKQPSQTPIAVAAPAGQAVAASSSRSFRQSSDSMDSLTAAGVEPSQQMECVIKLMLVGNSGVGKTCFLLRFANNHFQENFTSTVGIDFKGKSIVRGNRLLKLQVWDTAGQERYRSITTAYYRSAMGFLLIYDIADEKSFTAVQEWANTIKAYAWDNAEIILVGNKCDLEEGRQITTSRGEQLAAQFNFKFIETSAKDGRGVEEAFSRIADGICENMAITLAKGVPPTGTLRPQSAVNLEDDSNGKKCCC